MNSEKKNAIRARIMRGIALNREPGLHFAGNFIELSFDRIAGDALISLEPGPHCEEPDGQVDLGSLLMLADTALAACVRAGLTPTTRLATVALNLQFTGAPARGLLEAHGHFEGFAAGVSGRQGLSRVSVRSAGEQVAFGNGAFMELKPPPGVMLHPVTRRRGRPAPPVGEHDLKPDEAAILRHAEDAIARSDARHSFIRNFWGYTPERGEHGASALMKNGLHVGNRVNHVQGGLLMGLAAASAEAALAPSWRLMGITAAFVSPGEGESLRARSTVVHHGRMTAAVRTEVTGVDARKVLEVLSMHAHRSSP
jgi:acyl-coenzyme A thioesterase PaaI-like protein